jgi:drug/metabolite transporter (DMT)-like permease
MVDSRKENAVAAFFWMVPATLAFAGLGAVVKKLGSSFPNQELVFFRSLFNFVTVLIVLSFKRMAGQSLGSFWYPQFGYLALLRGVVGYGGIVCMFFALQMLPMPVALLLSWSSVIFTILLSWLFLKERIRVRQAFWILSAFFGVILLLWPAITTPSAGPLNSLSTVGIGFALAAALQGGAAYVSIRAAGQVFGVWTILFYFTGISLVLSFLGLILGLDGPYVSPSGEQGYWLVALGLLATVGQVMMTYAYQQASAPVVAAMNLMSPLFGAALGWVFFAEILQVRQWIALTLVGVSIVRLASVSTSRRSVEKNPD